MCEVQMREKLGMCHLFQRLNNKEGWGVFSALNNCCLKGFIHFSYQK
jgi:hypothetical protein